MCWGSRTVPLGVVRLLIGERRHGDAGAMLQQLTSEGVWQSPGMLELNRLDPPPPGQLTNVGGQ